jgi:hypothetical protein
MVKCVETLLICLADWHPTDWRSLQDCASLECRTSQNATHLTAVRGQVPLGDEKQSSLCHLPLPAPSLMGYC